MNKQQSDPIEIIDDHGFEITHTLPDCPSSYAEALKFPDAEKWHQAALEEMASHKENNTWTLVDLPPKARAIKGRWIFTKKPDQSGIRYKSRFVARGYSQRHGIDYQETYSSVLAHTSLRILICIAVNNGWKIFQKDFKTAYLNAPLHIPIYMEQPQGFVEQGGRQKVCLLNKALYGLKQAGRAWQIEIFNVIRSQGYQQSKK